MSRLDYFTIIVIGICVLAIAFLLYKTSSLISDKDETSSELKETLREMGIEDDSETMDYEQAGQDTVNAEDNATETNEEFVGEEIDYAKQVQPKEKTASTAPSTAPATKTVTPVAATKTGEYLVVAGSFSLKQNADNEAKRFRDMGYPNTSVEIFNKGSYATLVVDRFETGEKADMLVKELKEKGIPAYTHKVRPEDIQ